MLRRHAETGQMTDDQFAMINSQSSRSLTFPKIQKSAMNPRPGRVRLVCIFRGFFNGFFDCPRFPRQLHRNHWRSTDSRVNFAEVVSANEYGKGVTVIMEGLGVSQRPPAKPFVEMPH